MRRQGTILLFIPMLNNRVRCAVSVNVASQTPDVRSQFTYYYAHCKKDRQRHHPYCTKNCTISLTAKFFPCIPCFRFQAGFKPVPFPAARSPRVHLPSPLQGRQLAWAKTCQPESNQNPARLPAREQKKKEKKKKERDVYCASSCIVTVLRIVYVVSKRYAAPGLHGNRSIVYFGGRLGQSQISIMSGQHYLQPGKGCVAIVDVIAA